ncbi:F0F1 ATP synthase subunit A [Rhabdothermincola sediminis]|uniref:F0F1 ATP synthase subunit A n=1 Tax=Rhabdothermincola sediminis TaxID=2751370 RepID=UPI001AA09CAD|nr:F0F1 ATP synthase subunit A [Rhabdothermincola sediminis]
MIFGLEFPEFKTIVEWPSAFGEGTWYGFNKIALINVIAVVATALFFFLSRKGELVPRGPQNLAESAVGFLKDGIIMQTIGPDGMRYLPYLASLFFFILIGNLFEIIPFFHMPANARMANPALLAIITWVFFIAVGFKHQGPLKYFKSALFPPGVPAALYLLVTPIEFISTFIVRPFSLAVRLFANMLAGHILLVTFSVLCITLWVLGPLLAVLPASYFMLVALTGFELMVAFLQAYIFTILAAVYIGGALHPDH